ncbi:P-loop containing nucleoside triphosphate hydrolase protein [Crassisporium funariophilum]|nr:P-loop containing nucleoside triphosphate hydrolase protein [Crassisporium funariophilum]
MSSGRSLLSMGLPKDVLANLARKGYENLEDLKSATAEGLANDLHIPVVEARDLVDRCRTPETPSLTHPLTQSAAALTQHSQKIATKCAALDRVLEGGLSRGNIVEISGPPGCIKEKLALNIVASFVEEGEEVIFIDCQNLTSHAILIEFLEGFTTIPQNFKQKIHFTKAHTVAEFMLLMHQLPALLDAHPKVSLLVLNSISFPFQDPELGALQKNTLLEKVKQTITRACASRRLTIVTTSQLTITMRNADGTAGSFDTGATGTMLPRLGYLPVSKSHRVITSPDGPMSGFVKLLSSPKYPDGNVPLILEPYSIVQGQIVCIPQSLSNRLE